MSERAEAMLVFKAELEDALQRAETLTAQLRGLADAPVLTNDGLTAAEEAGLATHEEAEAVREQRQREADSLDGGMRRH